MFSATSGVKIFPDAASPEPADYPQAKIKERVSCQSNDFSGQKKAPELMLEGFKEQ